MLWLDDKVQMSTKDHQGLGVTAACVVRGVQATEELTRFLTIHDEGQAVSRKKRLYSSDSWFGSAKAVASVATASHHVCFSIKRSHSISPKTWVDEKTRDYPGGTWITFEATHEKHFFPLFVLNIIQQEKMLTFVMTK